jgi:hypothetical protein
MTITYAWVNDMYGREGIIRDVWHVWFYKNVNVIYGYICPLENLDTWSIL